jgi:uroporphyrin-III C-methyltransferase/precorrin-2 dehydrogenase/sirohydrochlorin ferrochelatase
MSGFPLLLDVTARRVLVVGGGAVAARRAARLAEAAAAVEVVAQEASPQMRALGIPIPNIVDRDVDGAWLVFACTDDPAVNEAVARSAAQRSVFCVRADHAAGGTARTPAVVEQDGITVAVTGGDDPGRSTALRDAIALALDVGELPARPTRPPAHGSVALVGGGPGDPDLITVRGRRLVAAADVIVIDRLAPRGLLATLPGDVEVVDCGSRIAQPHPGRDQRGACRSSAGKQWSG